MGAKGDGVVPETAAQRAMADVAKQQMADWKQRWLPIQQRFARHAESEMQPGSWDRKRIVGAATTDNAARFGLAQQQLTNAAADSGTMGSSRQKLNTVGLGADQATATGLATVAADQAATDSGVAGLQMVNALGRGEKSLAVGLDARGRVTGGLARSAAISGAQAEADAQDALAGRIGNASLVGRAVGLGLSLPKPKTDRSSFRLGDPYRSENYVGGMEGE